MESWNKKDGFVVAVYETADYTFRDSSAILVKKFAGSW